MKGLSDFEEAVLRKLLAGDNPMLKALQLQTSEAFVKDRENTGVGFYCTFVVSGDGIKGKPSFSISDVGAELEGLKHGAGFALFVSNGKLDMLEGFSYDEPWPEQIRTFELSYLNEPRKLSIP